MARPSRCTYPGRAGPGRFQICSIVNSPAWASPVAPQTRPIRPMMSPITLDRRSWCTFPVSWLPICGDLVGHGVDDILPEGPVDRSGQAEHSDHDQQEREQCDETGVGEVGDQHPPVIVAVFLDHAEDKSRRGEPLLGRVHPPDHPFDWIHRPPASDGPQLPWLARSNWGPGGGTLQASQDREPARSAAGRRGQFTQGMPFLAMTAPPCGPAVGMTGPGAVPGPRPGCAAAWRWRRAGSRPGAAAPNRWPRRSRRTGRRCGRLADAPGP